MWNNIVEAGRPQTTIWRMRVKCQIPKATSTILEYVIFTAFQLGQRLHGSASMLHYSTLSAMLSLA